MSRQLDKAIAEALGYEVKKSEAGFYWVLQDGQVGQGNSLPFVSADGEAMLWLEEKMRERGWMIDEMFCSKPAVKYYWYAKYSGETEGSAEAETEPLARALAAYKALTGKDWEDV